MSSINRQSHIDSSVLNDHQKDHQSSNGEFVAKVFKYYRRLQNPHVNGSLPMKLVSGKALYKKHKEAFDKFAMLANDNSFDIERYIKYCVKCGIREDNVLVCISSMTMIDKYMLHLKNYNRRKKIYKWFLKSARNIANECISRHIDSSKEFIKELILSNKVGNYVASGKISMYFFAAIPGFEKAIPKLDMFSRQSLVLLERHFESYHSDINKAFLQEKNCKVNPIDFTDKLIEKMQDH